MRERRVLGGLASMLDPRPYLHGLRLLHYFNYSYLQPRRQVRVGPGVRLSPNVSIANGERVSIGARTRIGARCYLWAGDDSGRISIGSDCTFAPEVFLTAANYRYGAGRPTLVQPMEEADVVIGDDVWLGVRVTVVAGVTIGSGSVVGAGAVVTEDLPPDSIAVGVPARVVGRRTVGKPRSA